MKTSRQLIIGASVLGVAVAIAVVLVLLRPEPPRGPAAEAVPGVTTAPVRFGDGALPVQGNGTVRPRAEVQLAPQVSGRVASVDPSMVSGGRFARGEVLVQLDPSDFRNAVEQARAQVAQDSVAVLEAEEESRIARDEYERFARREGIDEPPSPLVLRQPQLDAARAALARSKAQLSTAELNLSRTRITAPFDGVVRNESVDPGAFAAVGQVLGSVYASDAVEVVVSLTDADAALLPGIWELRPGDGRETLPATVTSDFGGRRYRWQGYVDRAETALDETSRTIDVVVRVDRPFRPGTPADDATRASASPAPPLLVGQYVQVTIQGRVGTYQVVPRRALHPGDEVWAVTDSLVRIVPVDILQQSQDSAFLLGGFEPGERVILTGINVATEGMKVRVQDGSGS